MTMSSEAIQHCMLQHHPEHGMTKRSYTEAVLQGVQSAKAGKALHLDHTSSKIFLLPILLHLPNQIYCTAE